LEKILDIIDSIAHEKELEPEQVREALKIAYVRTAERVIGSDITFEAIIDEEAKKIELFQMIEVVADEDERLDNPEEKDKVIAFTKACEMEEGVEVGDEISYELSLDGFGRTGAMALHNEIEYQMQRMVEDLFFNKYKSRIGKIITGSVVRVDEFDNTYIEIDEVRAKLPRKNRIKGESFKVGDVVKSIVRRVDMNKREGIAIELSRTTPKFLEALLQLEVPEIEEGYVIIEKCARIPGERAKVALYSLEANIDPVGATVGIRGVRINAVSNELCGESIDVINYSDIPEMFVSRAMSPSIVNGVTLDKENDKKAIVSIGSDQKAKAIGRSGINIRLASMLTGFEIELNEQESPMGQNGNHSNLSSEQAVQKDKDLLSSLFND
jgi:transcription termination/antitermination protein NusA